MFQASRTPPGTDDYVPRKLFDFYANGDRIAATYRSLTGRKHAATALEQPDRTPPGIEPFPKTGPSPRGE